MNAIELSHVTKHFPGFTLQDLSLTVPSGTICGLVGENGAGKSTTIRLLMGALRPDSGTCTVLGADSASPEFLVRIPAQKLGVRLLASRVDKHTGKTDGENCHGAEKVRRLHEAYPDVEIAEFYSDSRSDSPLAELAEHAYLVHGQTRTPW